MTQERRPDQARGVVGACCINLESERSSPIPVWGQAVWT